MESEYKGQPRRLWWALGWRQDSKAHSRRKQQPMAGFAVAAILLCGGVAIASPQLGAGRDDRVFVMPTRSGTSLDALADIVSSELPGAIRSVLDRNVLGIADLQAIMNVEKMKDLVGCDDVACYSEIANALGARWLVRSTLEESGDKLSFRGVLLDATSLSVVRTAERRVLRDGVVLKFTARDIVRELFDVTDERPPTKLTLPAEYDAREGRRNRVASSSQDQLDRRIQKERLAQEASGLPPELWIGENWTAYHWKQFEGSGVSRREYIETANEEATWPFVLELVFGGVAAVGLPLGVGMMMNNTDEPANIALAGIGMVALSGLVFTLLFDGLANPNLKYLGDQP